MLQCIVVQHVLGIEIWHALAACHPGDDVLVTIDERVDAGLPETVDDVLDNAEVGLVVDAGSSLNSFPHHTEPHLVEAPALQIFNIFVCEGVLVIPSFIIRVVGSQFVDNIDTMVNGMPAISIFYVPLRVDAGVLLVHGCD